MARRPLQPREAQALLPEIRIYQDLTRQIREQEARLRRFAGALLGPEASLDMETLTVDLPDPTEDPDGD
jgi:hypothetical protein